MTATTIPASVPEIGQLVQVRDRHWVVANVERSTQAPDVLAARPESRQHLLTLASVEDDAQGEELRVVWELELGTRVLERAVFPTPDADRFDDPARLDAFLDAVRWGAIASADTRALQAPFRSGITIEDYQLDPVVRALSMPRTNLLIADDVGFGKTIEAGLVAQELLLRHRARTVLVICPASLCVKWRDEMAEKFGLEFRIVDAALLRQLRRTRGPYANPWTHFPRLIASIDWLKRERPLRMLRDALPPVPSYPRRFDLLVVDEVHGCAPAGRGRYATDSQRTKAVRTIAPHFEHRLFLSATPHNGYPESFEALLELLDDQRFARGVRPDRAQLDRVMVRRMKSELDPRWDGRPRFPTRVPEPLEVPYTEDERAVHVALTRYAALRTRTTDRGGEGADLAIKFVLTLLKKRLFSSPPAFARTLGRHLGSMTSGRKQRAIRPTVRVLRQAIDAIEEEHGEEESFEAATGDAVEEAASFTEPLGEEERHLLAEMQSWAERATQRGDTKSEVLLSWLDDVVRPAGPDGGRRWGDERVIVFTEYRDTQRWLQERLVAHGLGGERLALLYGGMDSDAREDVKARFQAAPALDPVRILLATDAASEGIDLQRHCHRLVHYEIPWNPNRLEQRNGRIDRHGQTASEVLVFHFVGAGWQRAEPGSLEGDLQFLWTVVDKVERIREDLGSVGPVIAEQVEQAMLGRRTRLDTERAERLSPARRVLKRERDLRAEIARLSQRLRESQAELRLSPENIHRVVTVGLELARQPPLVPTSLGRAPGKPVFRLPTLTGSWARAAEGLEHPVTREIRPVTFDHSVAAEHDDVILVHLGHRLVQQCLRLLRAEVWATGQDLRLARVTARIVPDHVSATPAVVAHGRLVITGADGQRLHEELVTAGGALREGRFARLGVGEVDGLIATGTEEVPEFEVSHRLAGLWSRCEQPLLASLQRRAEDRAESLRRTLSDRADQDVRAITEVLTELRRSILEELHAPEEAQLQLFSTEERAQHQRDLDALQRRLDEIPGDIQMETAAIRDRYAAPTPRMFPAAITFFVPRGLAVASW
jgi:superfamily II DNA or RNA helicase